MLQRWTVPAYFKVFCRYFVNSISVNGSGRSKITWKISLKFKTFKTSQKEKNWRWKRKLKEKKARWVPTTTKQRCKGHSMERRRHFQCLWLEFREIWCIKESLILWTQLSRMCYLKQKMHQDKRLSTNKRSGIIKSEWESPRWMLPALRLLSRSKISWHRIFLAEYFTR